MSEEKRIIDRAKDAASDLKGKVSRGSDSDASVVDKAKEAASGAKDKVTDFVGEHEGEIHGAIDKTGDFVDEKVTRRKFSEHIGRARDSVKGAVSKVGGRSGGSGGPAKGKGETKPKQTKPKQTEGGDD